MSTRLLRFLILGALLAPGAGGCAYLPNFSPGAAPPPETDVLERDSYVIGQGDLLRITVWKNPELSVDGVPVRPDGKISTPLLDDIQAAGLTPEELKELIAKSLAEFVANPDVTVIVREVNSKRVYVLGQVARSAPIGLTQDMRVLDAISVAGGFTTFADKNDIKVYRRADNGGLVEFHFNYGAYLAGREPQSNMLLQPGDTIVVPD